ncbi:F-box domain [Arabidopsis thaliana x Arabidopsis arenosa]|uniref:F-box domain n=1 Tax=Arabidopsis thaliana x Arabidopsis arenosa TaxID=1240361 RepID=A0A8T1XII6_9BRAS|nr:F-box domain [Arabidopsis thaliana x Arabidopsis arenosa]
MLGRKKSKQACSKGFSQRLKEDRISQLTESLLCQILNYLPTKDVVKTSVLSTRWRSLWLSVPRLELDSRDFSDFDTFVSFCDRYFDSNRVLCINKLKLTIGDNDEDGFYLKSWIDAAAKRKIQHLDVHSLSQSHKIHLNIYKCETLVYLSLFEVTVAKGRIVSFPCMKTMHLEDNVYPNEATFKKLISWCPVLEDLTVIIYGKDTKSFPVHSRSLKRLTLVRVSSFHSGAISGVVINAPRLCSLRIKDNVSKSFIVKNIGSNAKLDLSILFGLWYFDEASVRSRRSSIHRFLPGILSVREMTIHPRTFMLMYRYLELIPLPHLPKFRYMSRLSVTLGVSNLQFLPAFLVSCPNLKSLILESNSNSSQKMRFKGNYQISFSSVPKCLLSSLEFVDIKTNILEYVAGQQLVKYFLRNSKILKKLTLHLNYCSPRDDIVKKLRKFARGYKTCQVAIVFD